jgi:CDP-glucose 4,6-dehydratase
MSFWKQKRVFLTGHTGFKGSWLCMWLNMLGADVTGYALKPPTDPSLFELCKVNELVASVIGDIRDRSSLKKALERSKPEIIIHMAAQPIVRTSYKDPVETYSINFTGTLNLLDAVRNMKGVKVLVNVTTDKVYQDQGKKTGYVETDPLGGFDPYSNSKAASELVTASYRDSFLGPKGMAVATARAGNVIGGGDWGTDRLVPDFIRAILVGENISLRNPKEVRPWQFVLDPLSGYLALAQKLYERGQRYAGAWNFGPDAKEAKQVELLVKILCKKYGGGASYTVDKGKHPHETHFLTLNCSKAKKELGWRPRTHIDEALDRIIVWTKAYQKKNDLRKLCMEQIKEYMQP